MAYWIITDKVLDKSSIETPFIILGPPGQHRWIYSLVNEKTKKLRFARSSNEYKIGERIHDGDIQKTS
jgi:hypothetical protein